MSDKMKSLVAAFERAVLDPLILLLGTLAVVYFLWGLAQFMWNTSDQTKKTEGKQHMIWGIVGLFIIASVYGIIQIVANTVGADTSTLPL